MLFRDIFGQKLQIKTNEIRLPHPRYHPGVAKVVNGSNIYIEVNYFGSPISITSTQLNGSGRIFLYTDFNLSAQKISSLYKSAKKFDIKLQVRTPIFAQERSKWEKPLAFISHDSRDKINVARPIAIGLQKLLCPIWYDEFSLKIGDSLRDSIEKGLKESKKCILIISPDFINNGGWTKTEFNTIFTRQILEESKLVLPIWYNVTKHDVFNYSPSLLDVVGLDWNVLGSEKIIGRLFDAITFS